MPDISQALKSEVERLIRENRALQDEAKRKQSAETDDKLTAVR